MVRALWLRVLGLLPEPDLPERVSVGLRLPVTGLPF
jgi:hypothetical protein